MEIKKIILISGKKGSGKSTLQDALSAKLLEMEMRPYRLNFADALYKMHDQLVSTIASYGIQYPGSEMTSSAALDVRGLRKDRRLLQMLGTEWGRETFGQDVWVNIVKNKIASLPSYTHFIIGDCRFKNEFDLFPEALRVRLLAPTSIRKARCTSWVDNDKHASEINLDEYAAENKFDVMLSTDVMTVDDCVQRVLKTLSTDFISKR